MLGIPPLGSINYKSTAQKLKTIITITEGIVEDSEKHPNYSQTGRERQLYGFAVDLNYHATGLLEILREINNV